jgi:hypothetical protein
MTHTSVPPESHSIEECIDELDSLISGMDSYAPELLAHAMRVHLGSLLHALVDGEIWSEDQVRQFVAELGQEALNGEQSP